MMNLGKTLIIIGILIVLIGSLMLILPKLPYIGKLPGDIHIKKEKFEIYIPLATSFLISIVISLIIWIIGFLNKK